MRAAHIYFPVGFYALQYKRVGSTKRLTNKNVFDCKLCIFLVGAGEIIAWQNSILSYTNQKQKQFQAHSLNVSCISENQLQCYADETPCDQDSFIKTSFGRVFPNVLASKTVGKHGPILLQEVYLVEKLQKLNRQNIPIRGAHGKGSGM